MQLINPSCGFLQKFVSIMFVLSFHTCDQASRQPKPVEKILHIHTVWQPLSAPGGTSCLEEETWFLLICF